MLGRTADNHGDVFQVWFRDGRDTADPAALLSLWHRDGE